MKTRNFVCTCCGILRPIKERHRKNQYVYICNKCLKEGIRERKKYAHAAYKTGLVPANPYHRIIKELVNGETGAFV